MLCSSPAPAVCTPSMRSTRAGGQLWGAQGWGSGTQTPTFPEEKLFLVLFLRRDWA